MERANKASQIPIQTIIRNIPDQGASDGNCQEIINMRYKDGALRNVGTKAVVGALDAYLPSFDKVYRHSLANSGLYIGVVESISSIYVFNLSGSILSGQLGYTGTFVGIEFFNSVMIVFTSNNKYYLLLEQAGQEYYLLNKLPDVLTDIGLNTTSTVFTISDYSNIDELITAINDDIKSKKETGYIFGHGIYQGAWRLFDGSYLYPSNPIYINFTGAAGQSIEITGGGASVTVYYAQLAINWSFSNGLTGILDVSSWSGIVASYDYFFNGIEGGEPIEANVFPTLSVKEISTEEAVNTITNLYKIKSLSLDTLDIGSGSETFNESINNLTSNEILPVDQFTHHTIISNTVYNYNNRVHIGDITTQFYEGFNPFFVKTGGSYGDFTVYVTLKTKDGLKTVTKTIGAVGTVGFGVLPYMQSIMVYPDIRAIKMVIVESNAGDIYSFDLTPHPVFNFSYFINGLKALGGGYQWKETGTAGSSVALSSSDELYEPNRIQVSEIDNPFYFPADQSYRCGNEKNEIIGMASPVTDLSDGQFGEFPLFIFTTQGIWGMQLGSGDVLYSAIIPVERYVCNNANSITQIDGGIVFSTDEGLRIFSGKSSIRISDPVQGEPSLYLYNLHDLEKVLDDSDFVELYSDLSQTNFTTFLQDAIIGYDNVNRELIISNLGDSTTSYGYSYVFNFITQTWHKISNSFSCFFNSYPTYYGIDEDDNMVDISDEEDNSVSVMFQTRPIKFGSLGFKKLKNMFLRGEVDVVNEKISGLYVFGSIDGINYELLKSVNPSNMFNFFDIEIKRINLSVKYYIFVFASQVNSISIFGCECVYEPKYNNKLR